MAVPGLLLAAAFAALGSGSLDALLRQSTGVDLTATVAETLGVPAAFNLSLFTLLAAAILVWSSGPAGQRCMCSTLPSFGPTKVRGWLDLLQGGVSGDWA